MSLSNKSEPLPTQRPNQPIINSHNEWDPLEEVIVGRVDGAVVPMFHAAVKATTYPAYWDFFTERGGQPFPAELVEGAARELDGFARVLEAEGVTVRRPDVLDHAATAKTPDFESSGLYAAMPRDLLITLGDEVIEAPMAWRSRFFEYRAYRSLMKHYLSAGGSWIAAPKPLMADALYDNEYPMRTIQERHELASRGQFVTREFEPCFDAADIMRCGRDLFMQRSQVTNQLGITWLRNHVRKTHRVHVVSFHDPNPMHIDATLVPLRPGLVLTNPDRPCHQIDVFERAGWEVVKAAPPTLPTDWPLYMSSRWLCMNLLVLDAKRVIVEAQEEPTQKLLRDLGFEVIKVPFRKVYTFGGSFHCVTCDIRRTGTLQDYGFEAPQL